MGTGRDCLIDFLRTVLPGTGTYALSKRAVGRVPYRSIEDMADAALRFSEQGVDVYYCTAGFDGAGFKGNNVTLKSCVVLDIDIRDKERHYTNLPDAITGLKEFINKAQFPLPTYIVTSGGGLHLYWAFPEDKDVDTARTAARGFISLLQEFADPRLWSDLQVTKSMPSLLRVPLTNNFKYNPPKQVGITKAGSTKTRLTQAEFDRLCSLAGGTNATVSGTVPGNEFGFEAPKIPVVPSTAVQNCAVLKHAVENQHAMGYDAWRDMLRIAAHAEDKQEGEYYAHMWSRNHPDYTEEETRAKYNDAVKDLRSYSGVKCDTFATNVTGDPARALCQGCKFFRPNGGSPLSAGAPSLETKDEVQTKANPADFGEITWNLRSIVAQQLPDYLSDPNSDSPYYVNSYNELVRKPYDNKKNAAPLPICDRPFWAVQDLRDPSSGKDVFTQFALVERDANIKLIEVPTREVMSAHSMCIHLKAGGLMPELSDGNKSPFAKYLKYTLSKAGRKKQGTAVSSMGWHEDKFIVGEDVYEGNHVVSKATVTGSAKWLADQTKYGRKGSMKKQVEVLRLYERPSTLPAARVALLVPLVPPLLKFANEKGMIVALEGTTGLGKSSLLAHAQSMWGEPNSSIVTSSDTHNGLINNLGAAKNIFLPYDDLHSKTEDSVSKLALMVSTATGPARSTSDGTINPHRDHWNTVLMVGTNEPIRGYLGSKDATKEAAGRRVVPLAITRSVLGLTPDEFAEATGTLKTNYGWIGPAVVDYIITNEEKCARMMAKAHTKYAGILGDQSERFAYVTFAAAEVAGQILEELGILKAGFWAEHHMNGGGKEEQQKGIDTFKKPTFDANDFLNGFQNSDPTSFIRVDKNIATHVAAQRKSGSASLEKGPYRFNGVIYAAESRTMMVVPKSSFDKYCHLIGARPAHILDHLDDAGHLQLVRGTDERIHSVPLGKWLAWKPEKSREPCYLFYLTHEPQPDKPQGETP